MRAPPARNARSTSHFTKKRSGSASCSPSDSSTQGISYHLAADDYQRFIEVNTFCVSRSASSVILVTHDVRNGIRGTLRQRPASYGWMEAG